MRAWVALAVLLAGCASSPVWHQGGVQCEPMPWDGGEAGGTDKARLARLVSYYEAQGVEVVDARLIDQGAIVPAVCGAWTGRDYELEVAGAFPQAKRDGWEPGPAPRPEPDHD